MGPGPNVTRSRFRPRSASAQTTGPLDDERVVMRPSTSRSTLRQQPRSVVDHGAWWSDFGSVVTSPGRHCALLGGVLLELVPAMLVTSLDVVAGAARCWSGCLRNPVRTGAPDTTVARRAGDRCGRRGNARRASHVSRRLTGGWRPGPQSSPCPDQGVGIHPDSCPWLCGHSEPGLV